MRRSTTKPISRVAIVGAGPSGISAAKHLVAERAFEKVDIFEQRREVGGIWNLTANTLSKRTPIPQLDPNYEYGAAGRQAFPGPPTGDVEHPPHAHRAPCLETPLYDSLETNIPKPLMRYADLPFGDDLPLFPAHRSVLDYCREYARDVRPLIRFGCQVSEVRAIAGGTEEGSGWTVATVQEGGTHERVVREYDAVVVASGHYSVPYVPAIEGIAAWSSSYDGSVTHSKAYRAPDVFAGKKVIVVGNSASGIEIGAQIAQVCKAPLLQSSRTENPFFAPEGMSWREEIAEIVEFLDPTRHDRSVRMADGRVEAEVDAVVFATGYFYSFPFLKMEPPVVTDGLRTRDLYQHLFHIPHPTLAFPVLPQRIVPFPMAENQAAVIARVWSGRLALPSSEDMRAWERRMLEERGDGRAMHKLNFPEDADYLNMLYDWAASAGPRQGLEHHGRGSMGTRWDDRHIWMRSLIPAIKMAYAERGEDRSSVKTVEELGFDFEKWNEAQDEGPAKNSSIEHLRS